MNQPFRPTRVNPAGHGTQWLPLAAVAVLSAMWGVAQYDFSTFMYQLSALFAGKTPEWISVVQGATFFLVAIPAAMMHRRLGYKLGMIIGLSASSFGPFLIYPTIAQHSYPAFAVAGMVMTMGWPFLETCLNPLAMELGPPQSAVRRLSFVQSFFPVGLLIGVGIARWLFRTNFQGHAQGWAESTARPFLVVGVAVLLVAVAIDKIRFPLIASAIQREPITRELRQLLSTRNVVIGLSAIFCCQVAQAICWGVIFGYIPQELPGAPANLGGAAIFVCFVLAGLGRFGGTALMRRIEPAALLAMAMVIGILLLLSSVILRGSVGLILLVTTSLFMSIAYPTIFGTVLESLGPLKKSASGLLVTAAGMGSAAELLLVAELRDVLLARYVMLGAAACFLMILAFAVRTMRAGMPMLPKTII